MGARIAACLAAAGVTVCATSRHRRTLRSAAEIIRAALAEPPAGSRPASPADSEEAAARILLTTDADEELARADLVIETIREDHADKIALLAQIAALARPDAIITTNTSSLDLAALADAVTGPGRFAGLHWFNPADLVELVEIVPAPATSAATTQTLRAWMLGLGKSPVVLGAAVPGFIANRLQYALIREAYALVAAGACTWADADLAVTGGLGPRWAAIGPFQSMDLAGLDVHLAVARALYPVLAADTDPPDLLAQLVAAGRLGVKSGAGLLGGYPPQRRAALAARRDAMLRTIAQARAPARPEHETTGSEQTAGAVTRKRHPMDPDEPFIRKPEATALLIVDMQNDFLLPESPVAAPGGLELVPAIARLAQRARAAGAPVLFTQEAHRPDRSDFGIEAFFEPIHCVEGGTGIEIVDGLAPAPADIVIRGKRRYDAFLGTDLDIVLRLHQIENLVVAGVCTDVCVSATVQHARNLDYRCLVLRDATAGTSRERHDAALLCLELVFARLETIEGACKIVGWPEVT